MLTHLIKTIYAMSYFHTITANSQTLRYSSSVNSARKYTTGCLLHPM